MALRDHLLSALEIEPLAPLLPTWTDSVLPVVGAGGARALVCPPGTPSSLFSLGTGTGSLGAWSLPPASVVLTLSGYGKVFISLFYSVSSLPIPEGSGQVAIKYNKQINNGNVATSVILKMGSEVREADNLFGSHLPQPKAWCDSSIYKPCSTDGNPTGPAVPQELIPLD